MHELKWEREVSDLVEGLTLRRRADTWSTSIDVRFDKELLTPSRHVEDLLEFRFALTYEMRGAAPASGMQRAREDFIRGLKRELFSEIQDQALEALRSARYGDRHECEAQLSKLLHLLK